MKIEEIKLLYEYNYWTNHLIVSHAEKLTPEQLKTPASFPWGNLHNTLAHIMRAESGWRILCQQGVLTFNLTGDDFADLAAIKTFWHEEEAAMWDYLNSLTDDDLDGTFSYEADGNRRERVLWHSLIHVVNHGTQHRSECAAMLTDFGHSPGNIDFSVFMNNR